MQKFACCRDSSASYFREFLNSRWNFFKTMRFIWYRDVPLFFLVFFPARVPARSSCSSLHWSEHKSVYDEASGIHNGFKALISWRRASRNRFPRTFFLPRRINNGGEGGGGRFNDCTFVRSIYPTVSLSPPLRYYPRFSLVCLATNFVPWSN